MKKLGVLALSDPSKGGTFQYTLSMLQCLHHVSGWEITLYTTGDNSSYAESGFPVLTIDKHLDNRIPSLLKLLIGRVSQEPFKKEDAVLAPIYSPVLLHSKKPFVYTLHDLQELYYPDFFSRTQRVWRRFIHSRLTRKAARIICESPFVKADIERAFKVSPEKIDIIVAPPLTLLPDDKMPLSGKRFRQKYDLSDLYLFYPAQFWVHKNHIRLIEAFARICEQYPSCQLVLTGKKRDEYQRVFKRIDELGISHRIRHIGYVDQLDLPGLYQEATALIMPSLFESISIPVFEAFQLGAPVAASNRFALPEQVGDAGLLFDPLSVDAIEAAIRKLLESSGLRDQLSMRGARRISELTFEKTGMEIEAALRRLVGPAQR